MWDSSYFEELERIRQRSREGGGKVRILKQHEQGKLTARERIELLFDKDSFIEVDSMVVSRTTAFGMKEKSVPGDGVIIGYGRIDGRLVFAYSEDFTVIGGTLGEYHAKKICRIMDMALNARCPLVAIIDSGGARIEEGIDSLSGYSGMFLRNTRASGVIPQISVMAGPCAGGACYSPAICDFVFVVEKTGHMFVTGPKVVKTVTGEETNAEQLGGADVLTSVSGVAHFKFADERSCFQGVRELLGYLPSNNTELPPKTDSISVDRSCDIQEIIPDDQAKPYDVKKVIYSLADRGSFFEIQRDFARNMITGFCRMDGEVLGIIANQPNVMAGVIDTDASDKLARFIRFCDCFNIPLITLIDTPGYMPGKAQEHAGIIRHGAKVLYAYAEATVPKIGVILRKAFGGAYIAMNSKKMGADLVFALPIARVAVMGAEGAVDIMYRKELAEDSGRRAQLIKEYEEHFMNPYIAASRGLVDEVIYPSDMKKTIKSALSALNKKRVEEPWKKHGNIPL